METTFGNEDHLNKRLEEKSDNNPNSLLRNACKEGRARDFEHLLMNGANLYNSCMEMLLHEASQGGSIEICDYLIQNGYNMYREDINGYIPCHYAIKHGHLELVQWYISKGVGIHTRIYQDSKRGKQKSPAEIAVYGCSIYGRQPVYREILILLGSIDYEERSSVSMTYYWKGYIEWWGAS